MPFQDLNFLPEVAQSTIVASAAVPTAASASLLIPKIEPKQEPIEEIPPIRQQQPPPGFSDFVSSNPTLDLLQNSQLTLAPDSSIADAAEDPDKLVSEYNRISELFREAFAKDLEQDEDFQVIDPDSRAIVPVPEQAPIEEDNRELSLVLSRRKSQRSGELVRVTNLGIEDIRHFRSEVRRTRRVYDCLRILAAVEEERRNPGIGRRARGDLRASGLMRERGLWLNTDKRIVGAIPGIEIGDVFFFRMELCVLGLHGQPQAGIDYLTAGMSSNGEPIATSVIVSGGYEDDQDAGDVIIYTGHGGRDKLKKSSRQCNHQKLEGGNLALERSMRYGIEVRVIRGIRYENTVSSSKVYVYDGLYRILDCWFDVGKSGFGVFKYKLLRMEGQPEMGSSVLKFAESLRNKPLSARPMGYVSLDISMSKENLPVFLYNDVDCNHDPMYYEYLPKTVFPPFVFSQANNSGGCACVMGCTEGCFCALKNGGEFAYDYNGLLLRGKPVIFECGAFCQCPPTCRNRVGQRGLKNKLEVFRSRETGWGVRSLDLIEAGAFICEYAGVVLTKEQAEVFAMDGDTLIYPRRFSGRWLQWGDLSQIFPDYVHPSYPSLPPLDFAMDVSRMRNVACYMSHSSTPNVLVQFVLYDHNNMMFPRLMLFAIETIPPLRELSLDYGVADESNEETGKLRICS